ncbi:MULTISPECIES: glycosyltransferase [Methylomonas]|uniref:glycosyltransferase n=1 Tax=Methylomonas TaxID=416 RepID=UPI0012323080|nr:glycosyltransferase [Methylomonas rhizoryzae]
MKHIVMVIGGGGFFFQSVSLLGKLNAANRIRLAVPTDSLQMIPEIEKRLQRRFEIVRIPPVTTIASSAVSRALNFVKCIRAALAMLHSDRPDLVVTVASSLAVPIFLAAKLLGIKTVYIDSITRVNQASTTGRLLSKFKLADRFYVQWPEAVTLYKGAVYKGTVL